MIRLLKEERAPKRKIIKKFSYKGFKIKQYSEDTDPESAKYEFEVFTKDNPYDVEWECDSLKEVHEFIDSWSADDGEW